MKVFIYKASPWQKVHLKGMTEWFAKQYIPLQTRKYLHVSIIMHNSHIDGDVGYCELLREREGDKPWLVQIALTAKVGTSKYQVLSRLAHELTHVKQYVKRELRDVNKGTMFKQDYFSNKVIDSSYYDLPWEIEAHGREYGSVKRYSEFAGIKQEVLPESLRRRL